MPYVLDVGNDAKFVGLQPQVLHPDPEWESLGEAESNIRALEGGVNEDDATDWAIAVQSNQMSDTTVK